MRRRCQEGIVLYSVDVHSFLNPKIVKAIHVYAHDYDHVHGTKLTTDHYFPS
jgi:hypothetical protein